MARILLFNPPTHDRRGFTREGRCTQEAGVWAVQWPPVTLTTAASLLEADGHQVRVVDFPAVGASFDDMEALLRAELPDFALWSVATPTLASDLGVADMIKRIRGDALTGIFGTHVTALPDEAMGRAGVDCVIRGEPEGIVREICRGGIEDLPSIAGVSYREPEDGRVRHNVSAAPLSPDLIPAPAWHCLDISPYRLPLSGRPFLIVAPVRGCPWRCNFCTAPLYYGSRLRKRPVASVVGEMRNNVMRYGVREFFIWADTFTADRRYVRELCLAVVESGLDISWTCNSRVDTIDAETLAIMKKAGLWMISFGLESGNDGLLEAAGKGISVAQSVAAVEMANRAGIRTAGHFIFGLPGETCETMQQTLDWSLSLPLDIAQYYTAAPFPGTQLYETALREGWLSGADAGLSAHPSQRVAALELPGLPSREVEAFRRLAYRRFYSRPRVLAGLVSMLEWAAAGRLARSAQRFLRWTK